MENQKMKRIEEYEEPEWVIILRKIYEEALKAKEESCGSK